MTCFDSLSCEPAQGHALSLLCFRSCPTCRSVPGEVGPDGQLLSPGSQDADAARALRLQAQVVREFARTEAVKAACQDPGTAEHGIALRAFHRIEQIVQVRFIF